jgi:hypothetical protein
MSEGDRNSAGTGIGFASRMFQSIENAEWGSSIEFGPNANGAKPIFGAGEVPSN